MALKVVQELSGLIDVLVSSFSAKKWWALCISGDRLRLTNLFFGMLRLRVVAGGFEVFGVFSANLVFGEWPKGGCFFGRGLFGEMSWALGAIALTCLSFAPTCSLTLFWFNRDSTTTGHSFRRHVPCIWPGSFSWGCLALADP